MNYFIAGCIGACVAVLLMLFVLLPISLRWTEENTVIIQKTNNGIICKKDKQYPELNCVLIKYAIGPKLNTLKIKEE